MASIVEIDNMLKRHLEPLNIQMVSMQKTLQEIKDENNISKENYKKLESEVKQLHSKVDYLQNELIKNNVIIFGIREVESENLVEEVLNIFKKQLDIQDINICEIADIKRIGKISPQRPIKLQLTTKIRKMQILDRARLLKGTKIFIQPEFTKKVVEDRKILKPYMLEAREKGIRSYLLHNKIKIGEKTYTVEDLHENQLKLPLTKQTPNQQIEEPSDEVDYEETYSTPKNTSKPSMGAIPKRKDISPLEHTEHDSLTKQVQKIRDAGFSKKHKQQNITQFAFSEKNNQIPWPQTFFRESKQN